MASAFYRVLIPAVILLPTALFDRRSPRVNFRTLSIIAVGRLFLRGRPGALQHRDPAHFSGERYAARQQYADRRGLLTWLAFGRRPKPAFWIGLVLALAGALVIVWSDLARHLQLGSGDLMSLARPLVSPSI